MLNLYFVIICGLLALLFGALTCWRVMKHSTGNALMQEISAAVREGATAYLNRQYSVIGIVGVVVGIALWSLLGSYAAGGYLLGAALSGLAGYIGMNVSVRANVRIAEAARHSLKSAFDVSFKAGSVTGLTIASLGLLGLTGYFLFLLTRTSDMSQIVVALVSLGFGASLISIFARLGGGIFTKGADVGADLVGKVEAGIPEDDKRNAAVIADMVGDNAGDIAGTGADVFETYVVTFVATILLGVIMFTGEDMIRMMLFPLVIGGGCLASSVIGTFFVRFGKKERIMGAMYKGLTASAILSALFILGLVYKMFGFFQPVMDVSGRAISGLNLVVCALVGLGITGLMMLVTDYYTSTKYRPVRSIAKASETGHGTNVIQGLAVSMESTALPTLVIIAGIIISYANAGVYGISIAATTMLALAGMILSIDAYGPATDNAGGIAEMSELPKEVRVRTDALDAVGNTTKAVTKGYAIGSAGLAALVLFATYLQDLGHYFPSLNIRFELQNPYVVVGLLFGGLLPYLFGAMGMTAVGRAAGAVVVEVRRQFKEIKGIMEGKAKPEYGRAVDMLTKAAIREMIAPSLLPVISPVLLFIVVYIISGRADAFVALGAMLLGTIVTGLFVAISMTSGGGAWDNAKKLIESGMYGGKGSAAHKAAVTGDTVGDPYKDTAGPAVNPMIKIINIVALLMLAVLAKFLA